MQKWQAPGNWKIFDSNLWDDTLMNNRTIWVLEYIRNKSKEKWYVSKSDFENEIKGFLKIKYNQEENNSITSHFYRPLVYWDFIRINKNEQINLTIEGNIFLNSYIDWDYWKSKKYIISQLDNTKYPNVATRKVIWVNLYPFRILFKLLLENKELSDIFIKNKLIYILKLSDLSKYVKSKKLEDFKHWEEYVKFHTWIINSLVDISILNKNNNWFYSINNDVLETIKSMYDNLDYSDMFFENSKSDEIDEIVAEKRVKRNSNFISIAKERDWYKCIRNKNHTTFMSRNLNYTEWHHLLPMYQQKNFDFKVDDIENIVSLCANCHREVHFSDNKRDIIDKLYEERKVFFEKQNLNVETLYEVYSVF